MSFYIEEVWIKGRRGSSSSCMRVVSDKKGKMVRFRITSERMGDSKKFVPTGAGRYVESEEVPHAEGGGITEGDALQHVYANMPVEQDWKKTGMAAGGRRGRRHH